MDSRKGRFKRWPTLHTNFRNAFTFYFFYFHSNTICNKQPKIDFIVAIILLDSVVTRELTRGKTTLRCHSTKGPKCRYLVLYL